MTSLCFLSTMAVSAFVHQSKTAWFSGLHFHTQRATPSTNFPIDASLCPKHPLNEAPPPHSFPIPWLLDPDSAPTFPWGRLRQGGWESFSSPPQKDALLDPGKGTALELLL